MAREKFEKACLIWQDRKTRLDTQQELWVKLLESEQEITEDSETEVPALDNNLIEKIAQQTGTPSFL